MNRSFNLAALLLPAILFFASCEKENGNLVYRFTGLDLQNTTTANGYPEVAATDTIPRTLFGIRLKLHTELVEKGDYFDPFESSVYAVNEISAIRIWSDQPYNNIAAGESLNTKFFHFIGDYFHVAALTDDGTIKPAVYDEYEHQSEYPEYADLVSLEAPLPGDYWFYVRLTFEDSTVFTDSTFIHLP
jgi:hypothetical protein